jgi:MFS family permease
MENSYRLNSAPVAFMTGHIPMSRKTGLSLTQSRVENHHEKNAKENGKMENKETQKLLGKLYELVMRQIRAGADDAVISQQLVAVGVESGQATQFVKKVRADMGRERSQGAGSTLAYVLALAGGVLAALISGVIWGKIAGATGYEIGFVAWGVGLVCGIAVVMFSGGKQGVPFQMIAALTGVLGIFIGKYCTFFFVLHDMLTKENGAEAASEFSLFSAGLFQLFLTSLGEMLGPFDLLWVVLAVITAWRIPRES